nr:LPXTG cell wall anchor domain-containing protein [Cohnella algarum]
MAAKPDVIPELPEAASYVAGSDETGEVIEVAEEEVPLGTVDHGVDAAKTIEEDEAPLGTLPQTGESGPLPFYLFGSALAVFGVCLLRKKRVN